MKPVFPFSAIVGHDNLKTSLLLIAIDPGLGGVLISGPRGSAKSTAVRALTDLIPEQPMVDIPLGATEEMIVGTLDLETALQSSSVRFQPGLIAKAHHGILYVDEVNLLPDHLVDLLLDVSASGINIVERDGISQEHPADFALVGTMNPDEGELRPQLLDRFGLMVEMHQEFSLEQRIAIVDSRLQFEADPVGFSQKNQVGQNEVADQILTAQKQLSSVQISQDMRRSIAGCCAEARVEGLRADIVMRRACIAHAALQGRNEVTQQDLEAVAELVLSHRRNENTPTPSSPPDANGSPNGTSGQASKNSTGSQSSIQGSWGAMQTVSSDTTDKVLIPARNDTIALSRRNLGTHADRTGAGNFSSVRYVPTGKNLSRRLDWPRSLTQLAINKERQPKHLRYRFNKPGEINLDLVLLDTSASTLSGRGLSCAKGMIAELSRQGYIKRRHLGVVAFGNNKVHTLLHPQRSPKNIRSLLDSIPAGGGTPVWKALDYAGNLLRRQSVSAMNCNIFLVTDGRLEPQVVSHPLLSKYEITLVDIESGKIKLGLAKQLARKIQARYIHISSLNQVSI